MKRRVQTFWLVLILFTAAGLRLWALADAPPGVTHDEADHALDAWGILQGNRPVYLTTGYGREPFYDYATAAVMALTGRNELTPRLTAAFFGLLLLAAAYAATRRLFGPRVALLAAAGLGLGFWPVMVGRQALRTVTLPALLTLSIALFLAGLRVQPARRARRPWWTIQSSPGPRWPAIAAAGLLLGLTFYTYIPARALWVLLPLLAGALWWRTRPVPGRRDPGDRRRQILLALLLALGLGAVVTLPLLNYLRLNPQVEVRIDELSAPLRAAQAGDWTPLLANARGTLRLFTVTGDTAWRYNIAGRPLLPALFGLLFYLGLGRAAWGCWRHPGKLLALAWLVLGLAPSLVTGPFLSTTQAAGVLPILYLFPALALDALLQPLGWIHPRERRVIMAGIPLLLFAWLGADTARSYFDTWATHPEVRVQYETTLVETLRYLNDEGSGPVAISTTTPRALFSPAVAALYLHKPDVTLSWFDGRGGLLLPPGERGTLVFDAFAPPLPLLAPLLDDALAVETLPLAPDDVNRPVMLYTVDAAALRTALQERFAAPAEAASFGGVTLSGTQTVVRPGGGAFEIYTLWHVTGDFASASYAGARTVQFVHLIDAAGNIVAQSDRLDVPSNSYAPGVYFVQRHLLPEAVLGAAVQARAGVYLCRDEACVDSARLPRLEDGAPAGDTVLLFTIQAAP